MTDSNSYYLLRKEESGLRACVCVETNSAEKIQALAVARGVELTPLPARDVEPCSAVILRVAFRKHCSCLLVLDGN